MISGRRRSVIFFSVLGICLVDDRRHAERRLAGAQLEGRGPGGPRPDLLPRHHRRRRAQHHLSRPRDSTQRAARLVHQRRDARAEDAGGLDSPLSSDAAVARARRGKAPRVLSDHARGQRSTAAHDRSGAARRRDGIAPAANRPRAAEPRARSRANVSSSRAPAFTSVPTRSSSSSAPATEPIVLGDGDELKAAVWNLIDNAVKYSPGEVRDPRRRSRRSTTSASPFA